MMHRIPLLFTVLTGAFLSACSMDQLSQDLTQGGQAIQHTASDYPGMIDQQRAMSRARFGNPNAVWPPPPGAAPSPSQAMPGQYGATPPLQAGQPQTLMRLPPAGPHRPPVDQSPRADYAPPRSMSAKLKAQEEREMQAAKAEPCIPEEKAKKVSAAPAKHFVSKPKPKTVVEVLDEALSDDGNRRYQTAIP